MKVTNTSGGPRAIHTLAGEVFFAKDETKEVTFAPGGITAARMIGLEVDGEEPPANEGELLRAQIAELTAKLAALDPDGAVSVGGSRPANPPALSNKSKAELLEIAKAEGVEVEDGATNDDIKSAIELHREG